ncbi:MAG TPA: UDP-N-acetylmuramoyl-L-alanyl-D-glutamate--2,6-diaminopimelate ligase [Gemmatimonadaceae bacterium]|nr:UDP-N-acetylmuramoyl-L-alanyl-D-glutamate--2,6-diaminopimelate ligase [Gemmatimonadaceae bacterium]
MSPVDLKSIAAALRAAGLLIESRGSLPEWVSDIADHSRRVTPGALFIAVRGALLDGHAFISEAGARGAVAAMVEDADATTLPVLVVRDSRRAVAVAAAAAFAFPARVLRLVGVTGTNGKTTTVNILRHLLHGEELVAASIGTLGVLVGSPGDPAEGGEGLTTPGPVELQRLFRTLVDRGVRSIVMEVSSHSLHQHRVEGVSFAAAVFTNLTRDHLDYHGTMEEYFAAKAKLVPLVSPGGVMAVNADDAAWSALPAGPRVVTFGVREAAMVRASGVRYAPTGSEWTLEADGARAAVRLPLIGDFNVANAVGAAAAAWGMGLALPEIAARLTNAPQVPGRLEVIGTGPTVLRDYAHTPDALERALEAVRPFAQRRLIVVFGCGGDRDRGKRAPMGAIAARHADLAIVTSDNPRTEDPERILDEIESGMPPGGHERHTDRREAIARALAVAQPDDVVLLAGKGHETYQVRGTTKYPFDEQVIVRELMTAGGER